MDENTHEIVRNTIFEQELFNEEENYSLISTHVLMYYRSEIFLTFATERQEKRNRILYFFLDFLFSLFMCIR